MEIEIIHFKYTIIQLQYASTMTAERVSESAKKNATNISVILSPPLPVTSEVHTTRRIKERDLIIFRNFNGSKLVGTSGGEEFIGCDQIRSWYSLRRATPIQPVATPMYNPVTNNLTSPLMGTIRKTKTQYFLQFTRWQKKTLLSGQMLS